jgi:hypothetical protein
MEARRAPVSATPVRDLKNGWMLMSKAPFCHCLASFPAGEVRRLLVDLGNANGKLRVLCGTPYVEIYEDSAW